MEGQIKILKHSKGQLFRKLGAEQTKIYTEKVEKMNGTLKTTEYGQLSLILHLLSGLLQRVLTVQVYDTRSLCRYSDKPYCMVSGIISHILKSILDLVGSHCKVGMF